MAYSRQASRSWPRGLVRCSGTLLRVEALAAVDRNAAGTLTQCYAGELPPSSPAGVRLGCNSQLEYIPPMASINDLPIERRFQLLVEAVVDYAIFLLNPEGIVTSWNTGA